jgi:tripartite-type tricarboxylate transporter receptor subunit TctC
MMAPLRAVIRWLLVFLLMGAAAVDAQPSVPPPAQLSLTGGRPLHWVVPWPPGGPLDLVARVLGQRLGEQLAVPVLVENRPGAQGNVGTEWVARGPVDGTVLLMAVPGVLTNPWFMRNSVNPDDLAPVVRLTTLNFLLLAHPGFAPRTLDAVIEAIRRRPGTVSCGGSGSLPSVGCLLLGQMAQAEMLQVPYRGNGPALNALVAGEINLLFDVSNTAIPQARAGRVRAIASTALQRGPGVLADVPTMAETVPGFELAGWQGVMVARGTPPGLVLRLNQEINAALEYPEVRSRLIESGLEIAGGSSAAFAATVRSDSARYARILAAAGVKPE